MIGSLFPVDPTTEEVQRHLPYGWTAQPAANGHTTIVAPDGRRIDADKGVHPIMAAAEISAAAYRTPRPVQATWVYEVIRAGNEGWCVRPAVIAVIVTCSTGRESATFYRGPAAFRAEICEDLEAAIHHANALVAVAAKTASRSYALSIDPPRVALSYAAQAALNSRSQIP